jgi:hypothetical protein
MMVVISAFGAVKYPESWMPQEQVEKLAAFVLEPHKKHLDGVPPISRGTREVDKGKNGKDLL